MNIIVPDKKQLNDFVLAHNGSFQQSWEWGDLQEQMDRVVKRFMILDNDGKPQSAASFVRHDVRLGKYYWLCPRGPVFSNNILSDSEEPDEIVLSQLLVQNDMLKNLGGIFIRIEPQVEITNLKNENSKFWRKAPKDHNPRATLLIDLQKSEDELLSDMHSKTRYNIRLAERKHVKCKTADVKVVEFLDLLKKTAGRDGFHLHPIVYYEKLLTLPFIKLCGAYYNNQLIAAALISIFGTRATYLHGASDYEHRKLMAPHLLHWEIIRQMKQESIHYYDLGGISPEDDLIPGWQGITRFKKGFGGEYEEFIGSWDYVLDKKWYWAYRTARKVL